VLPTFFVIGAAKCGTTSLANYLGKHPEIHLSRIKEPRFFAEDLPHRPFAPGLRVASRDEYEALFESDAPMRFEASPSYSMYPFHLGVPERIHELVPDALIVYIVGDPVRRVVSHHRQGVGSGRYSGQTLLETLGNIDRPDNPVVCPGMYATQLERYRNVFPEERIHVIDQDDLRHERSRTLADLFGFLGVDSAYWSDEFEAVQNVGAGRRQLGSGAYGRLRGTPLQSVYRRLPERVRAAVAAPARRLLAKPVPPAVLDEETRLRLEDIYRPEVERLRAMTGQTFAGWSL
jgi:hypothetical protein